MGPEHIAVLTVLAADCVTDIKRKEILFVPTAAAACLGLLYDLACGRDALFILGGLIPGALLALLSVLSRQAVGFGDAVVLFAVGTWSGPAASVMTLAAALAIQAFASVVYRLAGGKKKELPFVPAVTAAYLMAVFIVYKGP